MTLLADADGQLVCLDPRVRDLGIDALLLDEEEIRSLDRERTDWQCTCPGCHQKLILKRWPMRPGLYLWQHWPGTAHLCSGGAAGESAAHHETKLRIAELGLKAGWTVDLESHGDGCVVDVLFTNKDQRDDHRPWEIQLSPLSTPKALERTRRLVASFGADPVWMHTSEPMWSKDVPSLQMDHDRNHVIGGIYDRTGELLEPTQKLSTTVPRVLNGRLTYIHGQDGGFGYFYDRVGDRVTKGRQPSHPLDNEQPGGMVVCAQVDVDSLVRVDASEDPSPVVDPGPVVDEVIDLARRFMLERGGSTITRADVRRAEQVCGKTLRMGS